ncbi:MAG: 2-C-methyl-D-erythritol 4-phosphate cytidylyltransferase, partial [Pseudomonadota bacterium]
LQSALKESERRVMNPTDEAAALETIGEFPLLVEGSEENLKVTSSSDLGLAGSILARQWGSDVASDRFPQ